MWNNKLEKYIDKLRTENDKVELKNLKRIIRDDVDELAKKISELEDINKSNVDRQIKSNEKINNKAIYSGALISAAMEKEKIFVVISSIGMGFAVNPITKLKFPEYQLVMIFLVVSFVSFLITMLITIDIFETNKKYAIKLSKSEKLEELNNALNSKSSFQKIFLVLALLAYIASVVLIYFTGGATCE